MLMAIRRTFPRFVASPRMHMSTSSKDVNVRKSLNKFFLKVHPDMVSSHGEGIKETNASSLQTLNTFLDILEHNTAKKTRVRLNESLQTKYTVEFYFRNPKTSSPEPEEPSVQDGSEQDRSERLGKLRLTFRIPQFLLHDNGSTSNRHHWLGLAEESVHRLLESVGEGEEFEGFGSNSSRKKGHAERESRSRVRRRTTRDGNADVISMMEEDSMQANGYTGSLKHAEDVRRRRQKMDPRTLVKEFTTALGARRRRVDSLFRNGLVLTKDLSPAQTRVAVYNLNKIYVALFPDLRLDLDLWLSTPVILCAPPSSPSPSPSSASSSGSDDSGETASEASTERIKVHLAPPQPNGVQVLYAPWDVTSTELLRCVQRDLLKVTHEMGVEEPGAEQQQGERDEEEGADGCWADGHGGTTEGKMRDTQQEEEEEGAYDEEKDDAEHLWNWAADHDSKE